MHIKCHHCGARIPVSEFARQIGKIGKGAAKRRAVDYSALARKSHEARERNKAKKSYDGTRKATGRVSRRRATVRWSDWLETDLRK